MRHPALAKERPGTRPGSEPDSGTTGAEPARRMVGLSGLAVGPGSAAARPAEPGPRPVGSGPRPAEPGPAGAPPAGSGPMPGPAAQGLAALRRQADRTLRRMTVDGNAVASSVSGTTSAKHVMATAGQAANAQAGYGSRTYVTSEAVLTAAVDADGHDFAPGPARSARHDCQASVPVYQWNKTEAPPGGLAQGKPVAKSIDGASTLCEIGAVKTGTGDISITHFKKV